MEKLITNFKPYLKIFKLCNSLVLDSINLATKDYVAIPFRFTVLNVLFYVWLLKLVLVYQLITIIFQIVTQHNLGMFH